MRLLPVVLLLTACASQTARTTYRQGAFPTPAEFSPVEDAPHTMGQPGYAGEPQRLPRGTDRRILPQTPETRREAGVWSASAPDASGEMVSILGFAFAPATVNPEARTAAGICADSIAKAAASSQRTIFPSRLNEDARRCVAARMFWHCAHNMNAAWQSAKTNGQRYDAEMVKAWAATETTARAAVKAACSGVPVDDVDEWTVPIAKTWNEQVLKR